MLCRLPRRRPGRTQCPAIRDACMRLLSGLSFISVPIRWLPLSPRPDLDRLEAAGRQQDARRLTVGGRDAQRPLDHAPPRASTRRGHRFARDGALCCWGLGTTPGRMAAFRPRVSPSLEAGSGGCAVAQALGSGCGRTGPPLDPDRGACGRCAERVAPGRRVPLPGRISQGGGSDLPLPGW